MPKKGNIPWNKGTKGIMNSNSGSFKKGDDRLLGNKICLGRIPWNKGIVYSKIRGKNHWNWKGGKNRKTRKKESLSYEEYRKYRDWQKNVFLKDNWTCQVCKKHGGELHAHHNKRWIEFPELRYDIKNGKTMCPNCHRKTKSYGKKLTPGSKVVAA